jgi:hypothetical protein
LAQQISPRGQQSSVPVVSLWQIRLGVQQSLFSSHTSISLQHFASAPVPQMRAVGQHLPSMQRWVSLSQHFSPQRSSFAQHSFAETQLLSGQQRSPWVQRDLQA